MSGNVWEWCEDKWHKRYRLAPTNGRAWISGGTKSRILRGGSWHNKASRCRVANRYRSNPRISTSTYGFRVAMDVLE